jgi:hypothetical protein
LSARFAIFHHLPGVVPLGLRIVRRDDNLFPEAINVKHLIRVSLFLDRDLVIDIDNLSFIVKTRFAIIGIMLVKTIKRYAHTTGLIHEEPPLLLMQNKLECRALNEMLIN